MSAVQSVIGPAPGIVAYLWWGWGRATSASWHDLFCDVSTSLVRVSYSDLLKREKTSTVRVKTQHMTGRKKGNKSSTALYNQLLFYSASSVVTRSHRGQIFQWGQRHVIEDLTFHDATLTAVSPFHTYDLLAASDSIKATLLTLWTRRHTNPKELTAMQIPLLYNWTHFSMFVTSSAVWLSKNRANQLRGKLSN